jgi:hypothetical protein
MPKTPKTLKKIYAPNQEDTGMSKPKATSANNTMVPTTEAERIGLYQHETRYNAVDGTTHDTPEAAAHASIQHNMKTQLRDALLAHRELDVALIDGVVEVLVETLELTTLHDIIGNAYALTAKHAPEFLSVQ